MLNTALWQGLRSRCLPRSAHSPQLPLLALACLFAWSPPTPAAPDLDPRQVHHLVCASAYELLLDEDSAALPRLQQLSPTLPAALRESVTQTMSELQDAHALMGQEPNAQSEKLFEDFNQQWLTTLIQVQQITPPASAPLDDLPERLDYVLALYVLRFQLDGASRPARELSDSYLALEINQLAEDINRDLLEGSWQASTPDEQRALLDDAQLRWKYVANQLLRYRHAAPAPLNLKRQVSKISDNLRELRTQLGS